MSINTESSTRQCWLRDYHETTGISNKEKCLNRFFLLGKNQFSLNFKRLRKSSVHAKTLNYLSIIRMISSEIFFFLKSSSTLGRLCSSNKKQSHNPNSSRSTTKTTQKIYQYFMPFCYFQEKKSPTIQQRAESLPFKTSGNWTKEEIKFHWYFLQSVTLTKLHSDHKTIFSTNPGFLKRKTIFAILPYSRFLFKS